MSLRLNKKQLIVFIILLCICAIGFALSYFLILKPMQADIAGKKESLKTEEVLLNSLQSSQNKHSDLQIGNIVQLLKKVPTEPLTEQFLLDFQKAEALSNSSISDVEYQDENKADNQTSTNSSNNTDSTKSEQQSSNSTASNNQESFPAGVNTVTYTLTVQSPTYEDMKTFLTTIENLSRITMIDAIEFDVSNESGTDSTNSTDTALKYTVTVSSFYYPELKNFTASLPKIDVPSPSNKTNPLSSENSDSQ